MRWGVGKMLERKFLWSPFIIWLVLWLYIVRDVEHKHTGNKEFTPAVLAMYSDSSTAHGDACHIFYGQGAQI
jgi:hypothetical protein